MSTTRSQFQPRPSVVYTQLDDSEAALFDLETERFYSLNETGCRIWELLQDGMCPEDISNTLQEEYDMDQEETIVYVLQFLEELVEQELIQKSNP